MQTQFEPTTFLLLGDSVYHLVFFSEAHFSHRSPRGFHSNINFSIHRYVNTEIVNSCVGKKRWWCVGAQDCVSVWRTFPLLLCWLGCVLKTLWMQLRLHTSLLPGVKCWNAHTFTHVNLHSRNVSYYSDSEIKHNLIFLYIHFWKSIYDSVLCYSQSPNIMKTATR